MIIQWRGDLTVLELCYCSVRVVAQSVTYEFLRDNHLSNKLLDLLVNCSDRLDPPKDLFFFTQILHEKLEILSTVVVLIWITGGTEPILSTVMARWSGKCVSQLALLDSCFENAVGVKISSHFHRLIFFWSLVGQPDAGNIGLRGERSFRTTYIILQLKYMLSLVTHAGIQYIYITTTRGHPWLVC